MAGRRRADEGGARGVAPPRHSSPNRAPQGPASGTKRMQSVQARFSPRCACHLGPTRPCRADSGRLPAMWSRVLVQSIFPLRSAFIVRRTPKFRRAALAGRAPRPRSLREASEGVCRPPSRRRPLRGGSRSRAASRYSGVPAGLVDTASANTRFATATAEAVAAAQRRGPTVKPPLPPVSAFAEPGAARKGRRLPPQASGNQSSGPGPRRRRVAHPRLPIRHFRPPPRPFTRC